MATAPDKPTLTVSVNSYSCKVAYGAASFGDPNTGTLTLERRFGSSWSTRQTKTATGSYTYTDNTSVAGWSNTERTYRATANNGSLSTASDETTVTTLPPNFSIDGNKIEASNVTGTSFDVLWHPVALGTKYQVDLYASIDGGQTWVLVAQDIQNVTDYTHTFTGLTPGETYRVNTQTRDSAGRVVNAPSRIPVVTTTPPEPSAHSLMYGPVEEEATIDVTGTIEPGGAGNVTAFDGTTFWGKIREIVNSGAVQSLRVVSPAGSDRTWYLYLSFSDGTATQTLAQGIELDELAEYGITATYQQSDLSDYVNLTPITAPSGSYSTEKITDFYGSVNGEAGLANKVYGSVNGQAKIIHQGFGHAEYHRYGRVVYYTDSSHTTTRTIGLESQSDIDGLCAQNVFYTTWDASVQGISIPNTNIKEVYLTSLVSSIPSNFLYYCTSLDNLDFSQTTITTTNPYFVNGCSSLNVPITIPQTLTTILGTFFSNNTSFNQPITLPSGLVSIGYNFFTGNNSMTSPINVGSLSESIILEDTSSSHSFNVSSSSAAYTNGIPIAGSNRAAWIARFPNLSGTWYRKLIDAGY